MEKSQGQESDESIQEDFVAPSSDNAVHVGPNITIFGPDLDTNMEIAATIKQHHQATEEIQDEKKPIDTKIVKLFKD